MTSSKTARLPRPDLSKRPFRVTVEREMAASPTALYRAWTETFDGWFAHPGAIHMRAAEGEPFYFETEHKGMRHPHYGRFLTLRPDELIELTWMTGVDGTGGAETLVTVEFAPTPKGTRLRLTHAGFYDQATADRHQVWNELIAHLDEALRPHSVRR